MFEMVSLSCAVVERLLRRSSSLGRVRSVNSMELMIWGCVSMYWGMDVLVEYGVYWFSKLEYI